MDRNDRTARAEAKLNRPTLQQWELKRGVKWAACLAVPLHLVVFLGAGGGALLGAGASILPYLAILACPLAMFFMMRGMQGHQMKGHEKSDAEAGHGSSGASTRGRPKACSRTRTASEGESWWAGCPPTER